MTSAADGQSKQAESLRLLPLIPPTAIHPTTIIPIVDYRHCAACAAPLDQIGATHIVQHAATKHVCHPVCFTNYTALLEKKATKMITHATKQIVGAERFTKLQAEAALLAVQYAYTRMTGALFTFTGFGKTSWCVSALPDETRTNPRVVLFGDILRLHPWSPPSRYHGVGHFAIQIRWNSQKVLLSDVLNAANEACDLFNQTVTVRTVRPARVIKTEQSKRFYVYACIRERDTPASASIDWKNAVATAAKTCEDLISARIRDNILITSQDGVTLSCATCRCRVQTDDATSSIFVDCQTSSLVDKRVFLHVDDALMVVEHPIKDTLYPFKTNDRNCTPTTAQRCVDCFGGNVSAAATATAATVVTVKK